MDNPISQWQSFSAWWQEALQEVPWVVRPRRDQERGTPAWAQLWQALQTAVSEPPRQREAFPWCFLCLPRVLPVCVRRPQLAYPTSGFSYSLALQARRGGVVREHSKCGLASFLLHLAIEPTTKGRMPPPFRSESPGRARGVSIARRSQRSAGRLGVLLVSPWVPDCAPCRHREAPPCPLSSSLAQPCPERTIANAPQILTFTRPHRRAANPAVQDAQRRLHQQGYDPGSLDGVLGEHTRRRAAVSAPRGADRDGDPQSENQSPAVPSEGRKAPRKGSTRKRSEGGAEAATPASVIKCTRVLTAPKGWERRACTGREVASTRRSLKVM